jgi:hypothetical protein
MSPKQESSKAGIPIPISWTSPFSPTIPCFLIVTLLKKRGGATWEADPDALDRFGAMMKKV